MTLAGNPTGLFWDIICYSGDDSGFAPQPVSSAHPLPVGTASIGSTGSAAPASANEAGLVVGANLRGWTGVNPSGSVYAGQIDIASVSGTTIAGVGGYLPVAGLLVSATAEFTRPGDTAAYAALDNIANSTSTPAVLTFANVVRANGLSGYVTKVRLETDQTTDTARFRLHLYKVAPTAINDNAGCTAPLYADRANWIGAIDLPAAKTEGGSTTAAYALNITDRLPFVAATGDVNLYGLLETLDAFTPANGQKFSVTIDVDDN